MVTNVYDSTPMTEWLQFLAWFHQRLVLLRKFHVILHNSYYKDFLAWLLIGYQLSNLHVKIHVCYQEFSNLPSDWLAAPCQPIRSQDWKFIATNILVWNVLDVKCPEQCTGSNGKRWIASTMMQYLSGIKIYSWLAHIIAIYQKE